MPPSDAEVHATSRTGGIWDRHGRPLRELRVSITDRCNFRCSYCMPREHFDARHEFLPKTEILAYEDITRIVRLLAQRGLRKVRITGGEPLLRRDVGQLVRQLKAIPDLEIAMTTNGSLLAKHAMGLRDAGLDRVTVSLDALDESVFATMSDSHASANDVLLGIEAAERAGFQALKINCVVKRGVNENQILPLAEHFRNTGHELRFIEYMDVGETNGWRPADVVVAREILGTISSRFALVPEGSASPSQTSQMFRYADGSGRVGVIASVSQPFCGNCNRARLTARGEVYPCLFAAHGLDVRGLIRAGASDSELGEALSRYWSARTDRYSELRSGSTVATTHAPLFSVPVSRLRRAHSSRSEMSYLGG